jgi:RNA-binding proteins (RRM domain)
MRTLFVNRLAYTSDAEALRAWFVSHGHIPTGVKIVCRPGHQGGNNALVQFEDERQALHALDEMDGKLYNHPVRGMQLMLSRQELRQYA